MTQLPNLYFLSLQPVSTGLETLIPRGAWLPREHVKDFIELELNYFELTMPVDKQEKNYYTDGLMDAGHHEKLGLLLHNGGKNEYIWIAGLTKAPLGESVPSDSCKWMPTATSA